MTSARAAVARAPEHALDLPPDPGAPRHARDWVTEVLAHWRNERVETARLLISELVTNAVLHARTSISVRHLADGTRARFEVGDCTRVGPSAKPFAPDSATGRGIRLVAALADDWGVSLSEDGKVVWFVLTRTALQPAPSRFESVVLSGLGEPATRGEPSSPWTAPGRRGGTVAPVGLPVSASPFGDGGVDVRVVGLPIDVYLDAEQHDDALVRELELIVASHGDPGALDVPRRLLDLSRVVRETFAHEIAGLRSQVDEALAHGRATVDLHMRVPRAGSDALVELAEQIDALETFCEDGDLLTLASSPRIRWFRRWYAGEVARQMRGAEPSPWREPRDVPIAGAGPAWS